MTVNKINGINGIAVVYLSMGKQGVKLIMLKSVHFENFRCYKKMDLELKEISIIVGENNSGKSTVVEGLRLISAAGKKAKNAKSYTSPPNYFDLPKKTRGVKLDINKLRIDLRGIVYYYQQGIAKVTAKFDDGSKIIVCLDTESAFSCIYDSEGKNIKYSKDANKYSFESIDILPQIGLIKENERKLTDVTITTNEDTYLSSRHFRNELLFYKDEKYEHFKKLAEHTWKGLEIIDLSYDYDSEIISLLVVDDRFTAEIGLMGSGLQMWLQIIWFISKSKNAKTIILDEPDVYMHPDLQRKVLEIAKQSYPQIIIATHSIEIISEVEPGNIVSIDKKSRRLRYATDSGAVQKIVDGIGGVYNLSLIRIGIAKKCLFVEGADIKILSKFHQIIEPDAEVNINRLPVFSLGGFSKLEYAFGTAKMFHDETKGEIRCFCILDRDYYLEETLDSKIVEAENHKLELHIWRRKEIENYLLEPNVIFRMLGKVELEYDDFHRKFENIIDGFKDDIFDQLTDGFVKLSGKGHQRSTCNKMAREYMAKNWTSLENKIKMVPGKEVLSRIRQWLQDEYKKSISTDKIIKNFKPEEIDDELRMVIERLMA
ncbi:ATP-dependent nuclease [Acetobacterium wieringae]|uniref:ATP-dependent nuclease n=1 Tax=Acetobacterium wieringae TaxID=52694 RepID=UPI002B20924F|nr:AAA family ATPase [Acetobacterium wieringae]